MQQPGRKNLKNLQQSLGLNPLLAVLITTMHKHHPIEENPGSYRPIYTSTCLPTCTQSQLPGAL